MTREEFISILEKEGYSYRIEEGILIVDHEGDVWLHGLKSLPPNVEFRNGGKVWLNSLISLPPNVEFRNGEMVCLSGLKTLPPNIEFRNGGSVDLNSLTSLPPNIGFRNGRYVYVDRLTLNLEDLDRVFQNNGDARFGDGWVEGIEFPESGWRLVRL